MREITTEYIFQMYHYPKDCFVRGIFNDIPYTAYALKHVSLNQANQTIFVHVRKDKMLKIQKETVYRLSYHINFSDKLMIQLKQKKLNLQIYQIYQNFMNSIYFSTRCLNLITTRINLSLNVIPS